MKPDWASPHTQQVNRGTIPSVSEDAEKLGDAGGNGRWDKPLWRPSVPDDPQIVFLDI